MSKLPVFGFRLPSHSVIHWWSSLSAGVFRYLHSGLAIVSATVHILWVTGTMSSISIDIFKDLSWNFCFHQCNCVLKLVMVLEVLPLVALVWNLQDSGHMQLLGQKCLICQICSVEKKHHGAKWHNIMLLAKKSAFANTRCGQRALWKQLLRNRLVSSMVYRNLWLAVKAACEAVRGDNFFHF